MKTLKTEKNQGVGYIVLGVAGILLSTYAFTTGNHFLLKLIMGLVRIFFHQHIHLD
jgi:hypothetical protein